MKFLIEACLFYKIWYYRLNIKKKKTIKSYISENLN